jgi:hypothetical protein
MRLSSSGRSPSSSTPTKDPHPVLALPTPLNPVACSEAEDIRNFNRDKRIFLSGVVERGGRARIGPLAHAAAPHMLFHGTRCMRNDGTFQQVTFTAEMNANAIIIVLRLRRLGIVQQPAASPKLKNQAWLLFGGNSRQNVGFLIKQIQSPVISAAPMRSVAFYYDMMRQCASVCAAGVTPLLLIEQGIYGIKRMESIELVTSVTHHRLQNCLRQI